MYHRKLVMTHEHTKLVVQSSVILHNYLMWDFESDSSRPTETDVHMDAAGLLENAPRLLTVLKCRKIIPYKFVKVLKR